MTESVDGSLLADLLGDGGPSICRAMQAASDFLAAKEQAELLRHVGQTLEAVPPRQAPHQAVHPGIVPG